MKLTDGEKLIILMLSDLYRKLGVKGEIDPEFIVSAIFKDHLWGIRWEYDSIPFEATEEPEVVGEVVDILDMWLFIEWSYINLSDDQKAQLEVDAGYRGKEPRFQGFDGNNESKHMSTAEFLVNELNRFQEFQGRDLNSHLPSLDWQRRMLGEFKEIRATLTGGPMSLEDLTKVLLACELD